MYPGEHFVGGERVARNQLSTIFLWSKTVSPHKEIIKHVLVPLMSCKRTASGDITASKLKQACQQANMVVLSI